MVSCLVCMYLPLGYRGQKRASGVTKLELQVVASCRVGTSKREARVLNS
ncbi:mCG1026027 [Mus musculus]|nr:mCG1026027 [Mus musculus]